jgi:hypothetical protein
MGREAVKVSWQFPEKQKNRAAHDIEKYSSRHRRKLSSFFSPYVPSIEQVMEFLD